MNRVLCIVAALALLLMPAARGEYDIDCMSLESLYTLREAVNARISELEQAASQKVYDSGTYKVGSDIPIGDYVLMENEGAVFASVIVRTDESEDSDLVSHHLINGQAVIRLREDTWLTLSEARAYPLSQAPRDDDGVYGEGGYWVGQTLPAGTYALSPADKAPLSSYSVYDGILGTDAQLTKFEVLHGTIAITVRAGEYIELSGCGLGPNETATEETEP